MFALGRRSAVFSRRHCWACVCVLAVCLSSTARDAIAGSPPVKPADAPPASQQQIIIDLIMFREKGNLARNFNSHLLKRSEKNRTGGTVVASRQYFSVLESPDETDVFLAFLQTMREEDLVEVLFEPHLVTVSGRSERYLYTGENIKCGSSIGLQMDYGIAPCLHFLPTLLSNGRIQLELQGEIGTHDTANGTRVEEKYASSHRTSRVHMTALMKLGETILIGGLSPAPTATTDDIPVLSQIPIIGKLFRTSVHVKEDDDLIMLVTVRLLDP
jgi:Flp pilus assembly secretin CpaC